MSEIDQSKPKALSQSYIPRATACFRLYYDLIHYRIYFAFVALAV